MNNTTLEFSGLPADVHHCTSRREGDWIIWRCPLCPGYERRLNMRTGAMRVKGKTSAQHTGFSSAAQNMDALLKNVTAN